MRIAKRIIIFVIILWVLFTVLGGQVVGIGSLIADIINAFIPIIIVLIGIGLAIKSIFR